MDFDIEMDDAFEAPQTEEVPQIPEAYIHDIITGEEQEPGEVDESADAPGEQSDEKAVIPYKIHVHGLDTFKPDDVKAWVSSHFSGGQFDRVEWVDDSSANLLFKSESTAHEALISLAAIEIADATQLAPRESLPAKSYAGKPECTLQVRFAVVGDKKASGAASRSRFYLLNPEFDPEERRRRGDFQRSKYRDRGDEYRNRDRRGDGRGDGRDGRRREYQYDDEDSAPFDVSLYDDDPDSLAKRTGTTSRPRRDSVSSGSPDSRDRRRSGGVQNRGKELFPDRRARGDDSRNRSLSPQRDRELEEQMDVDNTAREAAALRNREKARSMKERMIKDNGEKELFPDSKSATKELFPTKSTNRSRELFPSNTPSSGSKAQMDQIRDTTKVLTSANLADRITPRNAASTGNDLNIRGLANKRASDQGLAIKGTGASAKELFPDRFQNSSKELFGDKLEGRSRRRQKAEDSFF